MLRAQLISKATAASLWLVFGCLATPSPASEAPQDAVHQEPPAVASLDFGRTISPLISTHCLECHGPDAATRESGLRLDLEASAKAVNDSGRKAIVPGSPKESELIRRISSDDPDIVMPPPEAGRKLSPGEVSLFSDWIREGASYQRHWAFEPIQTPELPATRNDDWSQVPLDTFILKGLEDRKLKPSAKASKTEWIRRVYYDLIGLPPSPEAIHRFENDEHPSAYRRVVDELLASPRYGERWGRHWLDVARYGDSNGGDENHAYPHAYQYRNYVISAFNRGIPYDQFITEQLAGDLLPPNATPDAALNRLRATGFLAIGTKILAEQDPVKKQADTVDEQIDTVSKALLGVTVACARCHDHKFDPIPTRDYYALAGIFHSTRIENQDLETDSFRQSNGRFQTELSEIDEELRVHEASWKRAQTDEGSIRLEAEAYSRGNVQVDQNNYGKGIGIISDPGGQSNFAEYNVEVSPPGKYALEIRYAAAEPRPGKISVDGKSLFEDAFSITTGGWHPSHQAWHFQGRLDLTAGSHILRLESEPLMVHIDRIRLTPIPENSQVERTLTKLTALRQQRQELLDRRPKPPQAMAVHDADVRNTKIHVRGDHNALGEEVPRGFLSQVGLSESLPVPENQSGRAQLAKWVCHPENPLTARVIANRLWRWHFGEGLVASPDNFGTRGSRPTHPHLLDHLAASLIHNGWNLKSLQRSIVLSATYQLSSQTQNPEAERIDPNNQYYWKRNIRRQEAETFRDSLLLFSGRLSDEMEGGRMNVKSQDPSPEDLEKNQKLYEDSRRRSVYLPVVRSNVYDFLTLLDFPNAASPVGSRSTTTVPTQALLMMNHEFVREQATLIIDRLRNEVGLSSFENGIQALHKLILSRPPAEPQLQTARDFFKSYRSTLAEEEAGNLESLWIAYCHTLIMSNDFSYIW